MSQYTDLVALPRAERVPETKRRLGAAIAYIHTNVPARTEDNAAIANQRLRERLQPHLGELTDDDLEAIIQRAKHVIDQDLHEEVREIMRQVRGRAIVGHGTATRIRIDL